MGVWICVYLRYLRFLRFNATCSSGWSVGGLDGLGDGFGVLVSWWWISP